jgi:NADH-quinone oxidoreductase subunit B
MELSEPAILTQRKGFVAARPGRPVGANDPFSADLRGELADKGFLVAAADDLIAWARTGSLMWMQFGLACCDRDDADGDAALRRRALWLSAARLAAPV